MGLFQIGGEKNVCLIDMIALKDSEALNEVLGLIFSHEATTIVGFSFHSDIAMFRSSC